MKNPPILNPYLSILAAMSLVGAWFVPSMIEIHSQFQRLMVDYMGWFVLYQFALIILGANILNHFLLFLVSLKDKWKKS